MKKLSFLKPALVFLCLALLITTISRLALFFIFNERVSETPEFWLIFPIGLRSDLIIISYLSFLPVVLLTLLPTSVLMKIRRFFNVYFICFLSLFLLMELSTPDFIRQYDTRPNSIFLEYLIYPKEVFGTLFKSYWIMLVVAVIVMAICIWLLIRNAKRLFTPRDTPYTTKLILFPLIAFLLVFGARGSLTSRRPINVSNAVFSVDQLTNCLGLNSLYTVAFAAYSMKNEGNVDKMYGKMKEEEAIARVKKYMDVDANGFTSDSIPLLHMIQPDSVSAKPYNLVIILEESLGAEYVGCLGGKPLTPEIDKLALEGTLFTNMYATGTRSVRGIEAVVTGFLPSPSESVVKLSDSQSGFYTVAALLEQKGYDTSFIYGGMANFDNMASFFNGNGFNRIIDEDDFDAKKSAFHGTWGWSDEDVLVKANDYFKTLKKPFVSLVFSSSNHEPFEFPDGRIQLYDKKKNTVNNAMKYADYAVGKFFDLAKKEAYYKNTVFLVIADHNTRTFGKHLVPIHKFHIPALLIGPNVEKGKRYDALCSQIDIQPTVLTKLGLSLETPMPGRNLFRLAPNVAGRAIMQFHDINAFRVGNQVVVMQPFKKPLQFRLENDTTFIAEPVNPELAKDALGHVSAASWLYKNEKYRLRKIWR
ncbi:sulfatase-like hydrolase/transferase [Flavobacterium sp. MAH-1]|uniref:Sulfatase-like hydrolase/transferase n=1 Tax=Flavobacterium agri TaxID=2743471 RepID=A0A7Y8XZQ6_9FLAO|nr:LTA synthase family protein [Flavobacterium agri]NUY79899.1 sulfatase-like hydrolase/transferase [Flavobacterium agri]NYA69924.1 sulfatase-like hydrolase/transferase [Flavobacterium agri]